MNVTSSPATQFTVNKRPITVTALTDTKPYDGTTSSSKTPTLTSGSLANGDTVTWTQAFDSKNAGSRTLTPVGTVSDGNSGNNYNVTRATASGTITTRPITVTALTDTKPYDGTTSSSKTPTLTSGSLANGDTVTWTQAFQSKDAGTNKTIVPAGSVSDGNGGNNYAVTFVNNTTGVITVLSTATGLTSSVEAVKIGYSVKFIATVSPPPDSGDVTFTGGVSGCTAVPVSGGKAECTTVFSSSGDKSITAKYNGSTNYSSSTSSAVSVTVFDSSLAVVSGLDAFADNGKVYVQWETTMEAGTAGFYLYRQGVDGEWVQVNQDLAPGFLNTPVGGTYRLLDAGAKPDASYTYKLVEVEHNGGLLSNGPYTVTAKAESRPALSAEKAGFSSALHASVAKTVPQIAETQEKQTPTKALERQGFGAFFSDLLASIGNWFGGLLAQVGITTA